MENMRYQNGPMWHPDPDSDTDSDESEDMIPSELVNDNRMSLKDSRKNIYRLHEKWENTPWPEIPLGVKRRIEGEIGVNIQYNQSYEKLNGWDIALWSARKRRRIQKLARNWTENEKTVCALKCLCILPFKTLTKAKITKD